jgi:phosphatidylserine/phosphatidylglycerophosphate/cardiolipin synthase-like enzyme
VDFVRPARPVSVRFVTGRGHYDTVIRAVREAKTSVWIATANLKELMVEDTRWTSRRRRVGSAAYRSVIGVFSELSTAGVELRILHASAPSRPFRDELRRHPAMGLEMRLCPRVHLKAVIVDGSFLYLGSANWTGAGLGAKGTGRRNFEIGIVTDDALLLDEVQEVFDRIWRGAECGACKLRPECPRPLDLPRRLSVARTLVVARPLTTALPPKVAAGSRVSRRGPPP